ncbi:MAG: hypothetical protein ACE5GD_07685 [Candidatus Geothermarchaeales archaeon]
MKAAFTLTPAESKRLIAKAVVQMDEVKQARERGYIILCGGTTNGFVAQELLGLDVPPQTFTAGINMRGVLCATNVEDRYQPWPIILRRGEVVNIDMKQAFEDFHIETVVIKGANAVDPEWNVGVITSGFEGGTVAQFIGYVSSTGLKVIVPVGLEKLVASVKDSATHAGAKTLDYSMGANFGMYCLTNVKVVSEIQALKTLANVEAKHVASGGVGGSEGSVVLVVKGSDDAVRRAISIVEAIKGEKPVPALKGTCKTCPYSCKFQGMEEENLPAFLR